MCKRMLKNGRKPAEEQDALYITLLGKHNREKDDEVKAKRFKTDHHDQPENSAKKNRTPSQVLK